MPLLETSTAACRGGMLREEDGMPAHRRLFSIADRIRRGKSPRDEVGGVIHHGSPALHVKVAAFLGAQRELVAETGSGERLEEIFGVSQALQPSSAVGP